MKFSVTTHTLIKNEDRWIWYAIMAVIDWVDSLLIYDTGSTDKTLEIIKTINSPKIIFKRTDNVDRSELVELRQEQIQRTSTPWFMLLDGDEIWPRGNLQKLLVAAANADENMLAIFNRTRNCIGDVFHYLPESKGRYRIKSITGHLNVRLIRNTPGLKVKGEYPLEAYTLNGQPLQSLEDKLQFVDTWYLHTTHLPRSTQKSAATQVIDRLKKRKFWRPSLKMHQSELPEVFWQPRPSLVPPPIKSLWSF